MEDDVLVRENDMVKVRVSRVDDHFDIRVDAKRPDVFVPVPRVTARYPLSVISGLMDAYGPIWFAEEISREQLPTYVQHHITWAMTPYLTPAEINRSRILDFGCGAGSSSIVMGRLFPGAQILGVELEQTFVSLINERAAAVGVTNVRAMVSPTSDRLPSDIGVFDIISLSGVYEHLFPAERKQLLPMLWSVLKPGGHIFFYETPYRYFPIEIHTTGGQWLVNYLPARLAFWLARRSRKRNLADDDWNTMLRDGIRGASAAEILRILKSAGCETKLLSPRFIARDRIELWYKWREKISQRKQILKLAYPVIRAIKMVTGLEMIPIISIAMQKPAA